MRPLRGCRDCRHSGGPDLPAYETRPEAFAAPDGALDAAAAPACDVLEAADLATEAAHGASFERLGTLVAPSPGPGGIERPRAARVVSEASAHLACEGGARSRLRATVAAGLPTAIEIEVDGRLVDSAELPPGWSERVIALETSSARVRMRARPHAALSRLALEPAD